jgi:DNA (cytosine-5)-methyltransferase 1
MKFISLFAGIGGLDLGLERAGMECVAQVEIDDFCQKVLTKHWANVPKYKDVRDVGKHNLPTAELICGGFPCQDVSLAGKRAGLEGKRSTLWSEFFRIVCEIHPRWVIVENVPGLLTSDNGEFFTKILRELSSIGYDAEWSIIPAASFGAIHLRERVYIVSYPHEIHDGWNRSIFEMALPERYWEDNRSRIEVDTWKETKPPIIRVDDGLPSGLDELRGGACGNAVVPQVAEFIGNCVMKAETCLTNA